MPYDHERAMAQSDDRRGRIVTGLLLVILVVVTFVAVFVLQHGRELLQDRTRVVVDFRTITGLRKGSPVQLAGVEIGKVASIDFVDVQYECDPLTEDIGRHGEGRTDNCDETLFCSPVGLCAELEPMTRVGRFTPCIESMDCREDEVCITSEFKQREHKVEWAGPEGVCVSYQTRHVRVRVAMLLPGEMLQLVRQDSWATVGANSPLGDQLVSIAPGIGDPLDAMQRIHSRASLYEDIDRWRQRLDRIADNTEASFGAISGVARALDDPRMVEAIRGTLENVDRITGQIVLGSGVVGALVSDPGIEHDFALTLRGIRDAVNGVSGIVDKANRTLATVDRNMGPLLAEVQATNASVDALMDALTDPDNGALFAVALDDRSAGIADDLERIVTQTEAITTTVVSITDAVAEGKGTVGRVIEDPKIADDLGRALHRLERHDGIAAILRFVLRATGTIDLDEAQDPAGPP